MDIPNSGAIFTLGKSHLAENTQSYFYIKNDPIKRLVSGPHQSAVICESGRLFVWGENRHGQLGIGGGHNADVKANHTNNNSNNTTDVVTKPTCVKSLKTLGLKVADVAFGDDWAVILTLSNELFFTGRSIFDAETNVARNFTDATVGNEPCHIIRKPFRLEEFDDCLSKSEDTENFVTVLAGSKHFAVLTSFGRLIGWGSNRFHQLGAGKRDPLLQPHEIKLDSRIQQFTCGPESTLMLTESGKLYLTGHLSDFSFSQYTELQKNLAASEQIVFIHISKASEIYIVTNAGSIFKSVESVRNKSLIFERFYDYDSEEHGPIWKLLRGTSFYTVLTKAHKFYTTFSESGHHLKTFREISKFKNLRLLDMAVGDKHILVHGIPRSATLSGTMGATGAHRYVGSRAFVMATGTSSAGKRTNRSGGKEKVPEPTTVPEINGNSIVGTAQKPETPKPNTPIRQNPIENGNPIENEVVKSHVAALTTDETEAPQTHEGKAKISADDKEEFTGVEKGLMAQKILTNGNEKLDIEPEMEENIKENGNGNLHSDASSKRATPVRSKSPTDSLRSLKSTRSIRFEPNALEKSATNDKLLRPHTPYPEHSTGNSPQTLKKTPLRNYSYEAAMDQEFLDHTSPALADSLDNIPEHAANENEYINTATAPSLTPPSEDDEQLTVEINSTMDAVDRTVVVNEIRFINNGVDVTANVKQKSEEMDEMEDESNADSFDDSGEEVRRVAENILDEMEEEIDEKADKVVNLKNEVKRQALEKSDKLEETIVSHGNEAANVFEKATVGARDTVQKAATGARDAMQKVASNAGDAVHKAASNAGDAVHKAASNAGDVVQKAATGAKDAVQKVTNDAGEAMHKAAVGTREAVHKATTEVGDVMQKAAIGARGAVDSVGENAKYMASEARQAVETAGNNAAKTAGGAKNAVENALFKMADGTKNAVDAVADNISYLFQGKSGGKKTAEADEDRHSADTSKGGGIKTQSNTNTPGEDDERTTASVNSTHTSTGNPFDGANPFESELESNETMDLAKKQLHHEYQLVGQRTEHELEQGKGKVQQFFDDVRAKGRGISCRNEKAVRIDDEPPLYIVEDTTNRRAVANQNTSKVCSIL